MKTLVANSVEMTAKQLFEVTERFVAEYHRLGHLDSPIPTVEDVWTMLHAVNHTLWICPSTGRQAIKLLQEKYPPEKELTPLEEEASGYAHPI